MAMPKVDARTSTYMISAMQHIDAAHDRINMAHQVAERKPAKATELLQDAVETYRLAGDQLKKHADYVASLIQPDENELPYTVASGKYEHNGDKNYKYINSFATLAEAIKEWKVNRDYAFNDIEYKAPGGEVWVVTPMERD